MDAKEITFNLNSFIKHVKTTNCIWLLQAFDGMFAMIEDKEEQEYLPIWIDEDSATDNISDNWQDYTVENMPLKEFSNWLNELHEDKIMIAIYLKNKNVIILEPSVLQKKLKS